MTEDLMPVGRDRLLIHVNSDGRILAMKLLCMIWELVVGV